MLKDVSLVLLDVYYQAKPLSMDNTNLDRFLFIVNKSANILSASSSFQTLLFGYNFLCTFSRGENVCFFIILMTQLGSGMGLSWNTNC